MQQAIDEAGNIWNVDAQGNPIGQSVGNVNQQRGGGMQIKPADPKQPFVAPQANADLEGTQLTNEQKRANLMEARYGKLPQGYRWKPDMTGAELIPGVPGPKGSGEGGRPALTAKEYSDAVAAYQSAMKLRKSAEDMQAQFDTTIGQTSGPMGIADYFPSQDKDVFNSMALRNRGDLKRSQGFTGGEGNTLGESDQLYSPYTPSTWDRDKNAEAKIQAIRDLADETEQKAIMMLGGTPDANGNITPIQQGGPTVLPQAAGAQADPGIGPTDVTAEGGLRLEQSLSGLPDAVANMVAKGAEPSEITAFLNQKYAPFGANVGPDLSAAIGSLVQRHRANPRAPVKSLNTGWENFAMLPARQETTMLGRAADTDLGNFTMNAANAATAGLPAYMAGDQGAAVLDAARQSRPLTSMGGDIAGGVAGVLGTGGLANAAGRSAIKPLAMAGQALTKGGYVGNDIAFSAARGGFENGPVGAAIGGAVGGLGNKIGSGIIGGTGRAVRGITDPAVNRLAERGIPMNLSALIGNKGMGGKFLTALDSLPFVGANNTARLTEGFEQVNREIAKEAGAPIGFMPSRLGYGGAEDGLSAAGTAIDNSVAGVDVPLDAQFNAELQAAMARGSSLPDDLATRFNLAMQNRVNPAIAGGNLTGDDFSQVMRGLKGYKAETPKAGFEQDYREALSSVQEALKGNISRNASPEITQNLDKANTAYRDFKLIADAVKRARNGSRSGEMEVYTPSQMTDAISSSKYANAGTQAPFRQIVEDANKVLPPTVPNSGTADRMAAMQTLALPASMATGGAAATVAGVNPLVSLPLTALAMALSSKTGAKVAQKALTGRGPTARAIGDKILKQRRKAGLFGTAAGASMLPQSSQ